MLAVAGGILLVMLILACLRHIVWAMLVLLVGAMLACALLPVLGHL